MKKLLLLILCLLFIQCKQERNEGLSKEELYDYYNEKYSGYISDYTIIPLGDSIWNAQKQLALDSAVYYVDEALAVFPDNPLFVSRKVFLLLELRKFDEAIELAKKHPYPINGLTDYPYTKIIENRFYAMKCAYEGNNVCRNQHLNLALDLIEDFLIKHKYSIKASLDSDTANMESPYLLPVWQYYNYMIEMDNPMSVLDKLHNIIEVPVSTLQMYVNGTESDFMSFNGI